MSSVKLAVEANPLLELDPEPATEVKTKPKWKPSMGGMAWRQYPPAAAQKGGDPNRTVRLHDMDQFSTRYSAGTEYAERIERTVIKRRLEGGWSERAAVMTPVGAMASRAGIKWGEKRTRP